MTKKHYEKLIGYFQNSPVLGAVLKAAIKYLPVLNVAVYVILLVYLFTSRNPSWVRFLIVPAVAFLSVTVFRKLVNAARPYDVLGYEPFVPAKKGKGKSFPSRHTASAVIIALACCYWNIGLGAAMLLVSLLIGASRICAGVHYPKDVLFGAGVSVVIGVIGFWVV